VALAAGSVAVPVGGAFASTSTASGTAAGTVRAETTDGNQDWAAAAVLDLVGRQATVREVDLMADRLQRGWGHHALARSLTVGDEWAGGVVDDLYQQILRRGPDAAGRAHWVQRLADGAWTRDVAAFLFASPEFEGLSGGTTTGYVEAVYDRVLGRAPDADGQAYWVARIDGGGPRTEIALSVFTSVEANGQRVDDLYDHLLDRAPDASGRQFWSQRLITTDDLELAALLVSSAEYRAKATTRTDTEPTETGPGRQWEISTPEAEGMDAATLAGAREYAFVDDRNTQGVVVVRNGKIVAEWYAPGRDEHSWAASWSVAKSFTSAAIGVALDQGLIPSVDEPMTTYYPEWRGTPREGITLRHVLWMASGLAFSESYAPDTFDTSDIIQMVVFRIDQLAYAASRPLGTTPNTSFNYSSADTMLLSGVLQQVTGMPADEYIAQEILDPIAMEKVEWWRDGAGHTLGYCCFDTTSRGFARFGQLYLQGGEWGGEQIVPEAWVQESWQPSPSYDGYGYQWWLDAASDDMPAVYSMLGHDGQFVHVIPSLDLVVVRNGTYHKHPGAPVADPSLFTFYPPQGLVDGMGTVPPFAGWSSEEFLRPIIDAIEE
jgi:CubicO group peptidase (beta-lactamase class C family)